MNGLVWELVNNNSRSDGSGRNLWRCELDWPGWGGFVLAMGAEGFHYWIFHRTLDPLDPKLNTPKVLVGQVFLMMVSVAGAKPRVGSKMYKPGWSLFLIPGKDKR